MTYFEFFKMGAGGHLGFWKFLFFFILKPCQLWFLLLKTIQRSKVKVSNSKYREFQKSKMAAGGHLEKLKIRHSQLILIVQSNVIHGFRWFWPSWSHFCYQISLLRSNSRWPPAAILDWIKNTKYPLSRFFTPIPCQLWFLLLKTI